MSKAWFYGRHSTESQGMTEHIQKDACMAYLKSTLAVKGVEFGGWFYDAAVSGSKPLFERPEGMKLLLHAQPGDYLVISKLDRGFRNTKDGLTTAELLDAKGVYLVVISHNWDTSTALGRACFTMSLAFAQLERDQTVERNKAVAQYLKSRGVLHGQSVSSMPFGWRSAGSSGNYVPDEQEREQIEHFAKWRAEEGLSFERIYFRLRQPEYRWKRRGKNTWHPKYIRLALIARTQGYPKYFLNSRSRRNAAGRRPASA